MTHAQNLKVSIFDRTPNFGNFNLQPLFLELFFNIILILSHFRLSEKVEF